MKYQIHLKSNPADSFEVEICRYRHIAVLLTSCPTGEACACPTDPGGVWLLGAGLCVKGTSLFFGDDVTIVCCFRNCCCGWLFRDGVAVCRPWSRRCKANNLFVLRNSFELHATRTTFLVELALTSSHIGLSFQCHSHVLFDLALTIS